MVKAHFRARVDERQYVLDLLRRIVTVILATTEIVRHLPLLDIIEDAV